MDNTVAWFEVATADPEGAERFYGGLFGWTFAAADGQAGNQVINFPGVEEPAGGLYDTEGERPAHAVFVVQVADVEAACATSESLGGKVVTKVIGEGPGVDFAYLRDPSDSVFGIFHSRG
ncbi:VOC family protein [Nonomuraea sp. NPDC004297]